LIKKILVISNYGFMVGGGEHSFVDLILNLPEKFKPVIIAPTRGNLTEKFKAGGLETLTIPMPSLKPWYFGNILRGLKLHYQYCRRHNISLIYANGSRAAFYGGIVGRLLRIPVVWHCRVAERDFYFDPILKFLCTRIVANSGATAKRFGSQDRSKIQVIYNGLDLNWLQDETVHRATLAGDDWKVLLVVGRVSKWKRHDLAFSAFEAVARFDPKVHLICLGAKDQGEQKWWDKIQKQTRNSTVSERVHWIGQVDDVRPWLKSASVLILPSENEPFGRVLVEAMALGVPVVATRSGGVPEIVREGREGFLVVAGKADEIASAVKKILNDESTRDRIGQAAIKRAEFFSLDKHVTGMTRLFEETVGLRPDE
jgi:glycosyltransferase involved in cell wall biosynthesis